MRVPPSERPLRVSLSARPFQVRQKDPSGSSTTQEPTFSARYSSLTFESRILTFDGLSNEKMTREYSPTRSGHPRDYRLRFNTYTVLSRMPHWGDLGQSVLCLCERLVSLSTRPAPFVALLSELQCFSSGIACGSLCAVSTHDRVFVSTIVRIAHL